jgi:hypothetical protein
MRYRITAEMLDPGKDNHKPGNYTVTVCSRLLRVQKKPGDCCTRAVARRFGLKPFVRALIPLCR